MEYVLIETGWEMTEWIGNNNSHLLSVLSKEWEALGCTHLPKASKAHGFFSVLVVVVVVIPETWQLFHRMFTSITI